MTGEVSLKMKISILLLLKSLLAQKLAHFLTLFEIEVMLGLRLRDRKVGGIHKSSLRF